MPKHARKSPTVPPASERSTVSARIWRSTAARLAPSDVRIAISFFRARVLASTRLATLAHAIKRTKATAPNRSEEHTSELQSRLHLVCRLLLEKKKKHENITPDTHIAISPILSKHINIFTNNSLAIHAHIPPLSHDVTNHYSDTIITYVSNPTT